MVEGAWNAGADTLTENGGGVMDFGTEVTIAIVAERSPIAAGLGRAICRP